MEQETKDILAIQQIQGAAKLLHGEVKMETIVYSNGVSEKRIIVTYEDRDLFGHRGKITE
jgi:hypothetical protein|tara:strand:+ start:2474 stop:2653 length:180 start_codon:yes stop_codon:yes gene_type:complete